MTPTQAAKQWLAAQRQLAPLSHIEKMRDEAGKVLKAHMASKGLQSYRGIGYACTEYDALSTAKARELLGPTKTAAATVKRKRETLTDLKPAAAPAGSVDA